MLRERTEFVRTMLYIVELCLVAANFFVLYWFGREFHNFYALDLFPESRVMRSPASLGLYVRAYWLAIVIWAVILRVRGQYHLRIQTYLRASLNYVVSGFIFLGFFASFSFLLKFSFLSRLFMLAYSFSTVFWLVLLRLTVLSAAYSFRRRGYNYRNIVLVGTGRRAQEFMSLVAKHREWGYRIVGLLDKNIEMKGKRIAGYSALGVLEDLPGLLEDHVIDEVVFVVPRSWLSDIEECIHYCEAVGVPATLATDFFDLEVARGVPKEFDGFTYVSFETNLLKESELWVKRLFDILFSAFFLVAASPLMIGTAIAVKITSPGPVFFTQKRSGRNGRTFTLFKYRSMVVDAEARLKELAEFNEMTGPVFKITDDPRITRIGRFLRKTSLDEFPQFWNVLKGDMSLVGPRPPIPSEVEKYEPWQRRRLSMKPGITCLWQISGRSNIDFEDWMKLDLEYIDKWSLWLDVRILVMTVKAVLAKEGAK